MIDFLVVAGISIDTINEIKKDNNLLFGLTSNKDEVIAICNYLRRIGIRDIDSLLFVLLEVLLPVTSVAIAILFSLSRERFRNWMS